MSAPSSHSLIGRFAAFLRRFLPYAAGIPGHDTLNDVVNIPDGALFAWCFTARVESLWETSPVAPGPEVVAIDGQTSRRTHDRTKRRGPLHLVSQLLDHFTLASELVTTEAMGFQTKVAQTVLDRGGDYLLARKDSQPGSHGEVQRRLDDPTTKLHCRFETTCGDRGRIETCGH